MLLRCCFVAFLLLIAGKVFAADESAYDRVMRTNTLRCGYATWPPVLMKDVNTGALSGYSYDVIEAVAEKLGLKVEWTEETGWGVAEQGLNSGRFDVMCNDVCLDAHRTRSAWYSAPFIYSPVYVFGRADDARFANDHAALNKTDIKLAIFPNTIFDYAARDKFPKAARVDVNDLGAGTDIMMTVSTKKVDASFSNMFAIEQFNKNNETQLKPIGGPARYCHGAFLLPHGEANLKHSIDVAIAELSASGRLRQIFSKYMPDNGKYWQTPALPYEDDP